MDTTSRLVMGTATKVAIFVLMVALGMELRPGNLLKLWGRPGLAAGSLAAAFLIVPATAYAVFHLLPLSSPARAGLWAVAITAGAPMTYRAALQRGVGDPALAASFQVTAAMACVAFAPAWLAVTKDLPGRDYSMPALGILRQVAVIQLLPILVGMGIGRWAPEFARRADSVLVKVGGIALIVLVVVILAVFAPKVVAAAESWTIVAAFLIAVVAAISGYLLSGPDTASRVTIANADVQRNPGLALALLTWNLRETAGPAIVVLLTYVLAGLVVSAAFTSVVKRLDETRHRQGLAREAT